MPIFQLVEEIIFPKPEFAEPDGLLAIGGDLKPERLLGAYTNGIFPWFSEGDPILWWSPDPRTVIMLEDFKVSKSLLQSIKKYSYEIKFDSNFSEVIKQCALVERKHEDGTWITKEMIKAYTELHKLGFAHSVEVYFEGKLVGGLYGISLGNAFFGESMFHIKTDASKAAIYFLVEKLKVWNYSFVDAQIRTEHLISLGAKEIKRIDYLKLLENSMKAETRIGSWNE